MRAFECIQPIVIDDHRIRVGDVIDENHAKFNQAEKYSKPRVASDKKSVNTVFFVEMDGPKKVTSDIKSVSELARSRQQFNLPPSKRSQ